MAIIHNQINLFWSKPTYDNFKKSFFVKRILTEKDADMFLKIGAYLIKDAKKFSDIVIPWDESKKFEILKNPILENVFFSLGAEYIIKGVFLKNGYSINTPLARGLKHPVLLKGNLGKLSEIDLQTINYVADYISKVVDFSKFDAKQKSDEVSEKNQYKGQKLGGITKLGIPHPTSKQILDYIQLKRNHSLHRPFIISEFRGITKQLFDFLEYIAQHGASSTIKDLAQLVEE